MLARSLIVLLVILNLGVALWWLARDDVPPAVAQVESPAGVARLQLAREMIAAGDAAPSPRTGAPAAVEAGEQASAGQAAEVATEAPAASDAAPLQCYALGPFTDADELATARRQLQPRVARLHVREIPATTRRDWRVWLPPQADRAAAQALVARITAAGFGDYYIVASGGEANGIALGLYGSEASARRREAALHAAGFADVRAEPVGDAPAVDASWIDVAASGPLAAADAAALGAARLEPLDCADVPTAPAPAAR